MKSFAAKRDRFFKELWRHPWKHEGLKCKTRLPIDAVEQVFNDVFEDDLPLSPEFSAVLKSRTTAVINGVAKTYTTEEMRERLRRRRSSQ